MRRVGAEAYRAMPAKRLFVLGVGHLRRRTMEPGSRTDEPAASLSTEVVQLDERQWAVLAALKREFAPEELQADVWSGRAREAGLTREAVHRHGARARSRLV